MAFPLSVYAVCAVIVVVVLVAIAVVCGKDVAPDQTFFHGHD